MEKTSKEYAAKLAKEKYKTAIERQAAIDFYMKAVEETNVKGLLFILKEAKRIINKDFTKGDLIDIDIAITDEIKKLTQ